MWLSWITIEHGQSNRLVILMHKKVSLLPFSLLVNLMTWSGRQKWPPEKGLELLEILKGGSFLTKPVSHFSFFPTNCQPLILATPPLLFSGLVGFVLVLVKNSGPRPPIPRVKDMQKNYRVFLSKNIEKKFCSKLPKMQSKHVNPKLHLMFRTLDPHQPTV